MEGQILGNRYELLDKIGGGGMAEVYRAKCRLLHRNVAVKILRKDFSNDEEFIRRFRIEAQAAASLSHPNIVSIYDVGFDNATHYIVMEYVDGITLKDYITRKGPLEAKEALTILRQICSAIDHAHKNKIVHRDIKPHNILYTSEGVIKVTDFGIARAASFSTITMVGSTIGSVHYFSPEQARGGYTDEKSDIYSLGVVLYELVTGKLPFDGETAVAIALKHIQSEPEDAASINKNVPLAVSSIIANAMRKDQAARYQTASEMLSDINTALKEPDMDLTRVDENMAGATKKMAAVSEQDIAKFDQERRQKAFNPTAEKTPEQLKKDRITLILASLSGLLIIPVFAFIAWKIFIPIFLGAPAQEFVFDDYTGRYYEQVRSTLVSKGIEVKANRKPDPKIPRDIIISQSRAKNDKVKIDKFKQSIEFEVSSGPDVVLVPDLRMMDFRNAEPKAVESGLVFQTIEEFSDTVAKDIVIRTEPLQGMEVSPKTELKIFKSKGPEEKKTMVPYIIGKTREEALKLISESKLTVGTLTPQNSSNATDVVTRQAPEANELVAQGAPINLTFGSDTAVSGPRKTVRAVVALFDDAKYGDTIRVRAEIVNEDTGRIEIAMNEQKRKSEFPLSLSLAVPVSGNVKVNIYLDNELHTQF